MAKYPKFQPMLSGKCPKDLNHIRYPIWVSEKYDGIRCIIKDGVAYSRTMKPIPNKYVQNCLKGLPDGIDGELICGDIHHPDVFNISQSGIMSEDGNPDFKYYVFDYLETEMELFNLVPKKIKFEYRFQNLNIVLNKTRDPYSVCLITPHFQIDNSKQLQKCADYYVGLGAEGIMIRDINGYYKFGRSTEREGGLLKYKPFLDAEAVIIGFEELLHNDNEQFETANGTMMRSSHQDNKTPGDKLGAFKCKFLNDTGVTFNVGTGFTDLHRIEYWANRKNLLGKVFNFKYQNLTAENKPRIPSFKGFRGD